MVDEAELGDEIVEMFVAGVDVRLGSHTDNCVKVMDVHVDKDTEKSSQNLRTNLLEVLGKRYPCSGGKYLLIVDESLNPLHERVHVERSGQFCGLLIFLLILPPVFVSETSRHDRAAPFSAELAHGPVDQVYPIEEIHHMNCDPIIDVFFRGELDHCLQVKARL